MIKEPAVNATHYVLKVTGKHGLVFKTKHNDKDYLKKSRNSCWSRKTAISPNTKSTPATTPTRK